MDTRFSKFAPSVHEEEETIEEASVADLSHTGEEVLDLFKKIKDHAASLAKAVPEISEKPAETDNSDSTAAANSLRIFVFDSMHDILKPAGFVTSFYNGDNYLYKDPADGHYLLVITRSNSSKDAFNRTCNILSEYGQLKKGTVNSQCYFAEHYELIAGPDALQKIIVFSELKKETPQTGASFLVVMRFKPHCIIYSTVAILAIKASISIP